MDEVHAFLYPVLNALQGTSYSERFRKILVHKYVSTVHTRRLLFETHAGPATPTLYTVNKLFLTPKELIYVRITSLLRRTKYRGSLARISTFLNSHHNFSINTTPYFNVETGATTLPFYVPLRPGSTDKQCRERVNRMAETQTDLFHRNILYFLPKVFV